LTKALGTSLSEALVSELDSQKGEGTIEEKRITLIGIDSFSIKDYISHNILGHLKSVIGTM
jgi:hypothetical protein